MVWGAMVSKELDELNVRMANACVRGQLDASPFLQGILLQMMRKLEKDRRGVSMVGRPMASTALEHQLISEAAFEFALASKNKDLAMKLGQSLRPKRLCTDDLPSHSLPNPTLALAAHRSDILQENMKTINRLFSLADGQQERRLVLSIDHTYLSKQLVQTKVGGVAGLVGPAWSPCGGQHDGFLPFSQMTREAARTPAAPLMLECLCWNPPESSKNRVYSMCSQPMALKAALKATNGEHVVNQRNAGKWVSRQTEHDCLIY